MSDPAPFPKQAKSLALRGRLRPVTRINRRVLIAGTTIGILILFAAFAVALDPKQADKRPAQPPLTMSAGARTPDLLQKLPASYDETLPPRLGAPTTGDLGGTIVTQEKVLGLEPDWDVVPPTDFRPSDMEEAVRARRLAEAKLEDAAVKAGVFFDLSSRSAPSPEAPGAADPRGSAAELFALAARGAQPPETAPGADDQNLQSRKIAFASATGDGRERNPHPVLDPVSPYLVLAGSVIPASLLTEINSDLPGMVTAQVTQPVYDTVTGVHLLIPQGARLMGRYQSEVSFGQDRALLTWDRIVFPNGTSLRMSEPGTDAAGAAGVSGRTDNHWQRIFAAAGLASLLSIGAQAGSKEDSEIERALRDGFGDSVSRTGERIVERNLAVQPTIRVAPGTPVRVLVTRDLVLRPYGAGDPTR